MALQQHFGNAGGEGEVAIDLERRVSIEKIGIHAAARTVARAAAADRAKQVRHKNIGMIAVEEARPKVDAPSERPAGAVITTDLERFFRGGEKLRRGRRDLPAGINAEQMGGVAVMDVRLLKICGPLLQLAAAADL